MANGDGYCWVCGEVTARPPGEIEIGMEELPAALFDKETVVYFNSIWHEWMAMAIAAIRAKDTEGEN